MKLNKKHIFFFSSISCYFTVTSICIFIICFTALKRLIYSRTRNMLFFQETFLLCWKRKTRVPIGRDCLRKKIRFETNLTLDFHDLVFCHLLETSHLAPWNTERCQAFFSWFWENPTFSSVGNFLANYLKLWKLLGKELLKENSNVIFFNTLHLIINILFSGGMISALQKNPLRPDTWGKIVKFGVHVGNWVRHIYLYLNICRFI